MLNKKIIDEVICEIMHKDGPDQHIDGHEVITEFIMSLLADKEDHFEAPEAEIWIAKYAEKKKPTIFII